DAQDEAIINFTEVASFGDHVAAYYVSVAVDGNDDLWVSGRGSSGEKYQKFSGIDATLVGPANCTDNRCSFMTDFFGGHGSLVDRQGRVWYAIAGLGADNDLL